jgi:hypothetical protein
VGAVDSDDYIDKIVCANCTKGRIDVDFRRSLRSPFESVFDGDWTIEEFCNKKGEFTNDEENF